MVEGDLLVIFRGQAGAGILTDGVYEIDEVIDSNEVSLLSVASLGDRETLYYVALSTSLFKYGTSLHGCIMRRCANPIVLGDDLATSAANNTVTSATVNFKTNGVGVDDHLVIESGADAGEYRIDVVTTSPLNISETQVKLKNLDGTVPSFATATGLAFRVIRPLLVPTMVYSGISEYNGSSTNMEVAAYDPGYYGSSDVYRDCFSPSMVGSLISVTNSQNTANNGSFRITQYINPGRVEIDSASTTSDTGIQAIARVHNIWHPCDGRLEELVPWDLATFELHGVP
jgi:hypothetical protein